MKKEKQITTQAVRITPPNMQVGEIWIKGTAPLVVHKFSEKAKKMIREQQEAGSTSKSKRKKEAKDFHQCFMEARHISMEGWDGFSASAIRNACISACRLVGYKMTYAKLSLFVIADGWDKEEGSPLIRIIGHEPRQLESMVRIGGIQKTVDIAVRPQWLEWGARLRIRYDADQFTASDIVNLVARVGAQCGICEGRPDSSNSAGCGWGTFEVSDEATVRALERGGAQ